MAIIRYTRYLLAVLAIVTLVAAAPSPTKTIGLFDQPPHTSPTCVIGVPAVQPSDGSFPITYYAIVAPTAAAGDAIAAHYKLNSTWSKAHRLDGNVSLQGREDSLFLLLMNILLTALQLQWSWTVRSYEMPVQLQCKGQLCLVLR